MHGKNKFHKKTFFKNIRKEEQRSQYVFRLNTKK